ncbi:uncharacterized protein MYCFIDRAFT_85134 [Pseudocercospora fijiensis CIRAD86]|uniref:F-box domain-containing protein n=1 Tax=Pseudocercospora fijiensis (strain CIRAD86) TaxID=383855 RepID=M2YW26_PSEFD|nr:uncharacterized protein MYCFIDRAFT_85134 [Pseudocercospora fijiensis CIRAD86]EME81920.1 hypothetical protein MYCFIDRAFT_85134 [Pseudocercospora fijiensis CIRAD86]
MAKNKRRVRDSSVLLPSHNRKPKSSVSQRITRRMTTDAARDAVLYTAELLQRIFEYLPPQSILTAQRVCHQFRDIVAQSSELQNKMVGKDESAVVEQWIVQEFPGNMGEGIFFHRLNQEALPLITLATTDFTYTLITPNDMIFRRWLPPMTEAEHASAVKSNYGGDVFKLAPSLKSALLELRSDPKASWQVLREALNSREEDMFIRAAWTYLYDGNVKSLDYLSLNLRPYMPVTSIVRLGSRSLQEVIAEKEQEYGVGAVMDAAPSISFWGCIQPSESVKKDVRDRGSEEDVVAQLKAGIWF